MEVILTRQFIYNGMSSRDLGIVLSGEDTWNTPVSEFEHVSVPGRSGDLLLSNKRFSNVDVTYRCGIPRLFAKTYEALMDFLLSDPGYHRLEDTYHPDIYRVGVFESEVTPRMGPLNHSGTFNLTFSCKPQQYLKSGEQTVLYGENGSIFNPTRFEAKPLIRVVGVGIVSVGDSFVRIDENEDYIDLDSELENATYGDDNANSALTLLSGNFPVIHPGVNVIHLGTHIMSLEITPRWWRL